MWWVAAYALCGVLMFRFTLWERDEQGNLQCQPTFAAALGVLWPLVIITGVLFGIGVGIYKALSIPGYYLFVPRELRKSKTN